MRGAFGTLLLAVAALAADSINLDTIAVLQSFRDASVDPSAPQTDVSKCVKDLGAGKYLRSFALETERNLTYAIVDLGMAMSFLSSSFAPCKENTAFYFHVQTKLDTMANAVNNPNVTRIVDNKYIVVGGAKVDQVAAAIKSGDSNEVGKSLAQLSSSWSSIVGGCSSNKACHFMDGILRTLRLPEAQIEACEMAIMPAFNNFTKAMEFVHAKNLTHAMETFAIGVDVLAQAVGKEECGLTSMGDYLKEISALIQKEKWEIEGEKVVIGSADLYDELVQAAEALARTDFVQFGVQIGKMLQQLQAAGCKTKGCIVLQGVLGAIASESLDLPKCGESATAAMEDFRTAFQDLKHSKFNLKKLGEGTQNLAKAVGQCWSPEAAKSLQDMANKLGASTIAHEIGAVTALLMEGVDVTNELFKIGADLEAKRWQSVGSGLIDLSNYLKQYRCNSAGCHIVEGILGAVGKGLQNILKCEKDVSLAHTGFIEGSQLFHQKHFGGAVKTWGSALNQVAIAIKDCGLEADIGFIKNEANVLGIANASVLGEIGSIIVHGADMYHELFDTLGQLENHDWYAAGGSFGHILKQLNEWTAGQACSSEICYVMIGILEFMGDTNGGFKECAADFEDGWHDFEGAYRNFSDHRAIFHFIHNKKAVQAGVRAVGDGFGALAKSVTDCHMTRIADFMAVLGTKLGISPEVSIFLEILHIVINGVHIEEEIHQACTCFADSNWPCMGYNLMKLVKTLVITETAALQSPAQWSIENIQSPFESSQPISMDEGVVVTEVM